MRKPQPTSQLFEIHCDERDSEWVSLRLCCGPLSIGEVGFRQVASSIQGCAEGFLDVLAEIGQLDVTTESRALLRAARTRYGMAGSSEVAPALSSVDLERLVLSPNFADSLGSYFIGVLPTAEKDVLVVAPIDADWIFEHGFPCGFVEEQLQLLVSRLKAT